MTSGYPPLPEPFAEARGEAAQTAAMAYRPVVAISDAVRRPARKRHTGREEEPGKDAEARAPGRSAAGQLRGQLGDDVLAVLMQGADWPRTARRLLGLQQVGVDPAMFLPQMGRMTAGVHQAVAAVTAPAAACAPAAASARATTAVAAPVPAPAPAAGAAATGRDVPAERTGAAADP